MLKRLMLKELGIHSLGEMLALLNKEPPDLPPSLANNAKKISITKFLPEMTT